MSNTTMQCVYLGLEHANPLISINVFSRGSTDINIHNVPEIEFELIARLCNLKIHKTAKATWIQFAKARDKSQVTFFQV